MIVRLCALLVAVVSLVACTTPPGSEHAPGIVAQTLAGTDDVELTYEVDPRAARANEAKNENDHAFGEDVRALVLQRLGAAQIGADVIAEDGKIGIVVDEMRAPRADELVTWSGTLLVLEADPDFALPPRSPPPGLTLVTSEDGKEKESWYEGSRADVLRAIETWPTPSTHRILAEAAWSGSETTRWRTRVAKAKPLGEIGDGASASWGDGPTIRIRVARGPGEEVLDVVREPRVPLLLARGHVSLGTPSFDDGIILRFGTGAAAYARAQQEKRLLATPRLPPLRRLDAMGLPPNRELAAACVIVPIALSLAWLAFVRRFDRAHPEPRWLIAVTFLLGAISTLPAGLAEILLAKASPWLDPNLATLGGQLFAFPLALVVFTIVVGLSEEGAKRLAAHFAIRRKEFDEPIDGIIYAVVASLGFAAAENVRYFGIGRMSAPLVIARCFMSIPAHMFFGALWGYALGARLIDKKTRAWAWLLLASSCHGLFDALLSTDGGALPAVILNVALASAFVAMVRDALRHGVVTEEMTKIRPEDRVLFRVGRPAVFWMSAIALHLLAIGIFGLGAYHQLARHRPSMGFVVGSSLMVALLGVAALGVAAALPLDVALDAYGITFGGAARAWRKIRGFSVHPHHVELDCEGGPIELGPGPRETIDDLARALDAHLGKDRVSTLESSR